MNIFIHNENLVELNTIKKALEKYFFNKPYTYDVYCYQNVSNLVQDFEDGMQCDLVFPDICTNNVGITTAKKLRNLNYTGDIIFVADSPQFAVESYDVQALGYLLKPLNTDKFQMTMDRFIKEFTTNKYTVQNHSKFINIPYNEILYIESDNSKCILHKTDNGCYTIYKKHLNVIQNELNDRRFLRCHQSYLVNMDYIASGDKSFVLTNGDIVCIRQRNLKAIKDSYLEYISFKKD